MLIGDPRFSMCLLPRLEPQRLPLESHQEHSRGPQRQRIFAVDLPPLYGPVHRLPVSRFGVSVSRFGVSVSRFAVSKGTFQPPSENLARPSTSLEMLRSNSIIVPSCWEFQQYINGVKMPARARGHLTQPEGHQRKANSPRDAR